MLHYFYTWWGQLIKRDEVLHHPWEDVNFFAGRSMNIFSSRLRRYLTADTALRIENVRGVGFHFLLVQG